MTTYFNEVGWPAQVTESEKKAFIQVNICSHFSGTILKLFLKIIIQDLHNFKTENFNKVVQSGACKLRPGVMRLMDEALAAGVFVAVCSTSNDAAVKTIVRTLLGILIYFI